MKPYRSSNAKEPEWSKEEQEYILQSIKTNHFRYAFQPIVLASSGEIYGYEALMRAGDRGEIHPDRLLDCAYENQCLYEIEKATFYNVMAQVKSQAERFAGKKVFINSIPGHTLTDSDYACFRDQYAEEMKNCVVEITEALELADEDLESLKQRSKEDGFELAIDDYGTGYSNTTNLLRHLPSCVKIDRLLISRIHEEKKKRHFVKSMVEFAHENGFLALAEGVETGPELRCVIELGVDLIQGFYTARPSFDVLQEIDVSIQNEIRHANVRGQTTTSRNVYVVTDEEELPLVRVALEQNTGILIQQEKFKLVGNPDYTAPMSIQFKDGCTCELTMRDVWIESFQEMPCIELGQNVNLTIILEGTNHLEKVGICVPESSKLTILGKGSLDINIRGISSYAIGNQWENPVGSITWNATGQLHIMIEAEHAIGIGGGIAGEQGGISLRNGIIHVISASSRSISVGTVKGNTPIEIDNCEVLMQSGVEYGVGIGSVEGNQNISIRNSKIHSDGSGSVMSFIGASGEGGGKIRIANTKLTARYSGFHINLLGTEGGDVKIMMEKSQLKMHGEGAEVMGFGSRDKMGEINCRDSECEVEILSGGHLLHGAVAEKVSFIGGKQIFVVND